MKDQDNLDTIKTQILLDKWVNIMTILFVKVDKRTINNKI